MAFTTLNGATLTSLDKLLKEWYLPPVIESLNNDVLLLARLDVNNEQLQGRRAVVPIHTTRAAGVGARAEGAPLPDAGSQVYANAYYDLTTGVRHGSCYGSVDRQDGFRCRCVPAGSQV